MNSAGAGRPGALIVFPLVAPVFRVHGVATRNDLERDVVAMLLSVEDAPFAVERAGGLGAEDSARRGVTVGHMNAGYLVVAIVLEAGRPHEARVDGGGGVTPLGEDPDRLASRIREIEADIEQVGGVQSIPLRVQGVTGVLDYDEEVLRPEAEIVEPSVVDIAEVEEGQLAVFCGGMELSELEQAAEAAELRSGLGEGVGVAGLGEEELAEVGAGAKQSVLGPLERRARALGEGVGPKGGAAVGGFLDSDPRRSEHSAVGVQVVLILGEDVGIGGRVEHDIPRVGQGLDGEHLELAACREIINVVGHEAIDKAVRLPRVSQAGGSRTVRTPDVLNDP